MEPGFDLGGSFAKQVAMATGQEITRCFQCKKCSAGCTMRFAMDVKTHQVMRLIMLGKKDTLLVANSFWVCSGCKTCKQRCPNQIDGSAVMDFLRQLCCRERVDLAAPQAGITTFHNSFLSSIRNNGRVFELGMIAAYKYKTKNYMQDFELGLEMVKRGKIAFWPKRIRRLKQVKAIFVKAKEKGR
ncbi:MAG: 4Fe-4S dicluster domain-containing protein [Heliobacteriaceae bacterium]|nr:4Fe-4S dicluster domain-containing protein [Heliobacteriaceae bacterium]MDD4586825.1 4Fe-4S dicluster domain-containing protein [Heliobacteriaceae bacterium]